MLRIKSSCCVDGGGDRLSIWYLMANEVERGFYNAGLLCSLFGQFINLVILNDVCMGFDFADDDIVAGCI